MRSFKNEEEVLSFLDLLYWGNAAGTCRQPEFAIKCAQSGMSAVMYGSITWEARIGNFGGDFYYDGRTGNSINALGLPNRGFATEIKTLPGLRKQVNALGIRLWVSLSAGDSFFPNEYGQMAEQLVVNGAADIIEGNFSCPNVEVNGKRKPPVCSCPEDFELGVRALRAGAKNFPIAVKIAPIQEPVLLDILVDICLKHDANFIVCSNTLDNQSLSKEDGSPALPGMIRGGMAGKCLQPIVSGIIRDIAPKLEGSNTRIIAVGGIETGADAYEYLCLGEGTVVGFQFNTALSRRNEDLRFVGDLITGKPSEPGLVDLLLEHGLPW